MSVGAKIITNVLTHHSQKTHGQGVYVESMSAQIFYEAKTTLEKAYKFKYRCT